MNPDQNGGTVITPGNQEQGQGSAEPDINAISGLQGATLSPSPESDSPPQVVQPPADPSLAAPPAPDYTQTTDTTPPITKAPTPLATHLASRRFTLILLIVLIIVVAAGAGGLAWLLIM
jgi:hypothetical protein